MRGATSARAPGQAPEEAALRAPARVMRQLVTLANRCTHCSTRSPPRRAARPRVGATPLGSSGRDLRHDATHRSRGHNHRISQFLRQVGSLTRIVAPMNLLHASSGRGCASAQEQSSSFVRSADGVARVSPRPRRSARHGGSKCARSRFSRYSYRGHRLGQDTPRPRPDRQT